MLRENINKSFKCFIVKIKKETKYIIQRTILEKKKTMKEIKR